MAKTAPPPDPFADVAQAASSGAPDPWADVSGATTKTSTPMPSQAYKKQPLDLTHWDNTSPSYNVKYSYPNRSNQNIDRPSGLQMQPPEQPGFLSTLRETYKDPNFPQFFGETPENPSIMGTLGRSAVGAVKGFLPSESPISLANDVLSPPPSTPDLEAKLRSQFTAQSAAAGERLYQAQQSKSPITKGLGYVEATGLPVLSDMAAWARNISAPTMAPTVEGRPPTKEETLGGVGAAGSIAGMALAGKGFEYPTTMKPAVLPKQIINLSQAMGPESVVPRGRSVEDFNIAARSLAQHGETVSHPAELPEAASRIVNKTLLANQTLLQRPEAQVPMLDPADLGDRAFNTKDLPFTLSSDEISFINRIKNNVTGEAKGLAAQQGGLITAAQADTIRRRIEVDYDNLFDRNDKLRNEMAWKLRDSYGRGITAVMGSDYPKLHQEMADAMHLQKVSGDIAAKSISGPPSRGTLKQAAAKALTDFSFGWYRGGTAQGAATMLNGKWQLTDIPKLSQAAADYYRGWETTTDKILKTAQVQPPPYQPPGPIITPPPPTPAGELPTSPLQATAKRSVKGLLGPGPSNLLTAGPPGAEPAPGAPGPTPAPNMPPEGTQGPPGAPGAPGRVSQPTHIAEGSQVSGFDAQGSLVSGQLQKLYQSIGPDGNPQWMANVLDIQKGKIVALPAEDVFDKLAGPPKPTRPGTTINPTGGAPTPKGTPKGPKGNILRSEGPYEEQGPFRTPSELDYRLAERELPVNVNNPFPTEFDRRAKMISAKTKSRFDPQNNPTLNPVTGEEVLQRAKSRPVGTPPVVIDKTMLGSSPYSQGISGGRETSLVRPEEMALTQDVVARMAAEYPHASRIVGRVEIGNNQTAIDDGLGNTAANTIAYYPDLPGGKIVVNIDVLRKEIGKYGLKAADATLYHEMVHASQHVLGVKGTSVDIEASPYRRQFNMLGGKDVRGPFAGGPPLSPKEAKHGVEEPWRFSGIKPGGVPVNPKLTNRFHVVTGPDAIPTKGNNVPPYEWETKK